MVEDKLLQAIVLNGWRFWDTILLWRRYKWFLEFHLWRSWFNHLYKMVHRIDSDIILNIVQRLDFGSLTTKIFEESSKLFIGKIVLGEEYLVEDDPVFHSLF